MHAELDINGGTGVVLIFDFGFCQRRFVLRAPVNGLEALVDIALFVHLAENLDLFRLEGGVHCLIRMFPVAKDAHAFEALHLNVDVMVGEFMAGRAELGHGHGFAVELVLLDDSRLNWHAVVVPAGDIGRIVTAHSIAAGYKVLERLVQSVSHMQVAVGKRRAVVQGEQGFALVLLEQLVIYIVLFPARLHLRLALRQAGTHGKISFGKVYCCIVVLRHVSFTPIFSL